MKNVPSTVIGFFSRPSGVVTCRDYPSDPIAHTYLGVALAKTGKSSEALEPQNGFARLMQAMASVHAGAYAQARSLLEEAALALPKDPDIANALARLLAAAPDPDVRDEKRAFHIIDTLLRSEQGDAFEEGVTMAMAFAAIGQFREAAETQRAIIHELETLQKFDLARLLGKNLELYEHEKPCRKPWASDDPVFTPVPGKLPLAFEPKTMSAHP